MSYFAKPNFIIYDEWFDDNLKKAKLDVKNKKIKNISNMHEFFYEQSNYKVGASEKYLKLDFKLKNKELFNKNYLENTLNNNSQLSIEKFGLFEKLTQSKIKFKLTKKIVYSLSIICFIFTLGFLLFFSLQSKKNESTLTNKLFLLEKRF